MQQEIDSARVLGCGIAVLVAGLAACAPPPSGPGQPAPISRAQAAAPNGAAQPDSPASERSIPTSVGPVAELEGQTFEAINAHRTSVGLRPLAPNRRLAEIARVHSRAMADGVTGFGHAGFSQRAAQARAETPARAFAENVWKSSRSMDQIVATALSGWLNSPVHRKNIDGRYTASGIGVARDARGTTYITQIFIGD